MKFTIKSGDLDKTRKASLIIPVTEKGEFTPAGKRLDKASGGFLAKLVKNGDFQAKMGTNMLLPSVPHLQADHILLVGCGKSLTVSPRDFLRLASNSVRALNNSSATLGIAYLTELAIDTTKKTDGDLSWRIKQLVIQGSEALYLFETYKSKKAPAIRLKDMILAIQDKKDLAAAEKALKQGIAIAEGMAFTKNLGNQPSNICTPSYVADQAKKLAKEYKGLSIKILEEKDMKKMGMGAFLSVTKGTAQPAKLVSLEYKGTSKKSAPIALVGKGITFDTGGLSLKPAESMVGMKYDMCGAATVLGTLKAIATLKLPIHVVGILALAENMPSGTASRPEDIVTTMSGQTVEILNTDAEGRLVLCDALTYCERFKPAAVIDIATLTGAVVVALGHHATGLLANDDTLAHDLLHAGQQTHDRAWQMPLWEEYQEQLRSPFADMSNVGGRAAGTITAACFLARFAKKFKWAHLDVAGTAAMMGGSDRYATGRPVPLLTQYLINRVEK
jgi:leucyl aminopeptidase